MPAPLPADHHSRSLKINKRVLLETTRRISLRLWPLLIGIYLVQVYLNIQDEKPFDALRDLGLALWAPLFFGGCFFGGLFCILFLGTKLKMKVAQAHPGPGKPERPSPLTDRPPVAAPKGDEEEA